MPFVIEHSYDNEEWHDTQGHVYREVSEPLQAVEAQNDWYKLHKYPHRQRVVEVPYDDPRCWRLREEDKLADGTHTPPPWKPDYNLEHMDPAKPTMIRFIRDDKDGQRGRYTSMTVGRFLSRFRSHEFTQDEIEKYCAVIGLDMEVSKLHVENSEDAFERIYLNGPHSCMAYEAKHDRYGTENIHPVRLYGDLDLAVAYIIRAGDITGRCLVWPETKIHGRIYGDQKRMRLRLEEEGYKEDWDFTGARLHFQKNEYGEIRAPYVDGELRGDISEDQKYIILSKDGSLVLQSDSGTVYTDRCGSCDVRGVFLQWSEDNDCYTCEDCFEDD